MMTDCVVSPGRPGSAPHSPNGVSTSVMPAEPADLGPLVDHHCHGLVLVILTVWLCGH